MITERLKILPTCITDADEICELRNDLTTVLWLTDPTLYSVDQVRSWILNMPSSSARWTVRLKDTNEFVGLFRLDHIDKLNKSIQVGLDIASPHRRKGYAEETYTAVLDYLDKYLGMYLFYLYVASGNDSALSLYNKLGFKESGRLPEAILRNGKRYDYIIMFKHPTRNVS